MDIRTREIFVSKNVMFYETFLCNLEEKDDQTTTQEDNECMDLFEDIPVQEKIEEHAETKEYVETEEPRRSTRVKRTPTFLQDYRHQIMATPTDGSSKENKEVRYPLNSGLISQRSTEIHLVYLFTK